MGADEERRTVFRLAFWGIALGHKTESADGVRPARDAIAGPQLRMSHADNRDAFLGLQQSGDGFGFIEDTFSFGLPHKFVISDLAQLLKALLLGETIRSRISPVNGPEQTLEFNNLLVRDVRPDRINGKMCPQDALPLAPLVGC